MIHARIEIAGYVMKKSGSGWIVGERRPRVINGRDTEEVIRPRHKATAKEALAVLMALTSGTHDELGIALRCHCDKVAEVVMRAPGPAVVSARKRAGLSQRALARSSGVARSTLQEIEYGRSRPMVDTVTRLLGAIR